MKYLLILATLFIVGCGDAENSSSSTPVTQESTTIDMVIDRSYSVSSGDRVANASTDAQVKVVKDIEGEATEVTLLTGSAQLMRTR